MQKIPTFHPSLEEFKDPLTYIESLIEGYGEAVKCGCIKIVPPACFKPPFLYDVDSEQKLPTVVQRLHSFRKGEPMEDNTEGRTFNEFKAISEAFNC